MGAPDTKYTTEFFLESLKGSRVSSAAMDRLLRYREDLLRFNRAQNLISRTHVEERVQALILESVCAAMIMKQRIDGGQRVLDLGSGGGIPGIPMAIVLDGVKVDFLERRRGRCDFLQREIYALGLEGSKLLCRDARTLPEEGSSQNYSWVLMKAVAPEQQALELGSPWLEKPGGRIVLFREEGWRPAKDRPAWKYEGPIVLGSGGGNERPALWIFDQAAL